MSSSTLVWPYTSWLSLIALSDCFYLINTDMRINESACNVKIRVFL